MEFRNERQIIGDSAAIRRVLQTVATAAPTRATVLLAGRVGHGQGAVRARDPRRRATGATGRSSS